MNFIKNLKKGKVFRRTGPGQRLDDSTASSPPSRSTAGDAKNAAAIAAERRLQAERKKEQELEAKRRERQFRIEEERQIQRELNEMSLQEREAYLDKQAEAERAAAARGAKIAGSASEVKKINPVLYTSQALADGQIAAPANALFKQIEESLLTSDDVSIEERRELAARLFNMANSSIIRENAFNRIRAIIQKIVENPTESKYREVKRQHTLYKDSVLAAVGAETFLLLSGFQIVDTEAKGPVVRLSELFSIDSLPEVLSVLESATEPLPMDVYRHPKAYFLKEGTNIKPIDVPDWCKKITAAELMVLQREREAEVEWWMTVCSKRRRKTGTSPFKVTVIRVRFPNSAVIEALFGVHESISDIVAFIAEALGVPENSFTLKEAVGSRFDSNHDETIGEIGLVPSAVLHFTYNDKNANLPLPSAGDVNAFAELRELVTVLGVNIADYKI